MLTISQGETNGRWGQLGRGCGVACHHYLERLKRERSIPHSTPPSNAGSNEADLATQVERINHVIEKASFCSSTIARGLTAASEAFANTDDQEAASFDTVGEYLRARGPR